MSPSEMSATQVAAFSDALGAMSTEMADAERIELVRQFEVLRSALAAAQARVTAAFVKSQRAEQRAAGLPRAQVGRGVASQIALARRISPHQAQRYVGWAKILTTELPATFAELCAGRTSEWRATLVARETAWLSREHRAEVDAALAPRLGSLGDRQTEGETRRAAYAIDPRGYVDRLSSAEGERHVSLRPAPDTMTRLSALLPLAQGVAVRAALGAAAASARAAGDARSQGQVMADTLVERCTGQSEAAAVPVEVQIVLPVDVLFAGTAGPVSSIIDTGVRVSRESGTRPAGAEAGGAKAGDAKARGAKGGEARAGEAKAGDERVGETRRRRRDRRDEPALLLGYGSVPASIARRLVLERAAFAPTWIRRLYADPHSGELVAMESRRRTFTAAQRTFIISRDQQCRMPWCDAPIRHIDHVRLHELGGPTSIANGQGLCETCNHAKQAPGWRTAAVGAGTSPDVMVSTPTGAVYRGRAPELIIPTQTVLIEQPARAA